ncbi:MAG: UDP-3-O-(3-hydroxymyristoyl)glucosamine N-acyltransferase [Verrucomicrobia bacterium]|nr:UDP-3-O-(3-hydroxymyristoyl)glucosamine N-acyltransferase [Verrucomicrobiota bacterium]
MKLSELAAKIEGVFSGDGTINIHGVAGIREAGGGEISFIANPRYASEAALTQASAVIVSEDWNSDCPAVLIRVKNPDAAFAKAATLFYVPAPLPAIGVHPSAVVAQDVQLGDGVRIGPLCVVESGVKIGARTVLVANCYIGYRSEIGEDSLLYPQVSLREFVKIGKRAILHNGTVVGSDGFGYSVDGNGVRTKIQQIGTVEIGDDVEIGANTTIDRARFGKTRIGNGVKIDNLVQVAHNAVLGDHVVLVAQVAIAGSTTIGEKTIFAGQSGAAGHLKIGSGVIVGAGSGVTKDTPDGAYVMGMPAIPAAKMKRNHAGLMLLPKLKERLAALDLRVCKLEENKQP